MTAREKIERAFYVSFKLPEQAIELLDEYKAEILREAAAAIRRENDIWGEQRKWREVEQANEDADLIDPDHSRHPTDTSEWD